MNDEEVDQLELGVYRERAPEEVEAEQRAIRGKSRTRLYLVIVLCIGTFYWFRHLAPTPRYLRRQGKKLYKHGKQMYEDGSEQVSQMYEDGKVKANQLYDDGSEYASQAYESGKKYVDDVGEFANDFYEEQFGNDEDDKAKTKREKREKRKADRKKKKKKQKTTPPVQRRETDKQEEVDQEKLQKELDNFDRHPSLDSYFLKNISYSQKNILSKNKNKIF